MLKGHADLADLQAPTLPATLADLLPQVFAHLGLQGAALQTAIQEERLWLSGTEVALSPDADGTVLVAAADLGVHSLNSSAQARLALRANTLLMLRAGFGVARGLGGPDSAQLIGRLHLTGLVPSEVAGWLASLAGVARSISDTAAGVATAARP
ncbi:MAG TPA: hypothetical protein VFL86_19010 [Burkholderiaceae bacterium]|nr:hypothetical protein [Burkholderiaceae bacterium]